MYARYGSIALLVVALGVAAGCSSPGDEVARAGPKPKAPAVDVAAASPATAPTKPVKPTRNPPKPTSTHPTTTHPTTTHPPVTPAGPHTLSVRGAGPYRIGANLNTLKAAGLISWTDVRQSSQGTIVRAGSAGSWAGELILVFRDGRLIEIGTATDVRSPKGAGVGMTYAQLEKIYGDRGSVIQGADRSMAYVVRIGSMVELYTGNPIREGVGWYAVGPADYTLAGYLGGYY